jgi:hypothetical protein
MQQTVRSAAGRAIARAAPGRPAADAWMLGVHMGTIDAILLPLLCGVIVLALVSRRSKVFRVIAVLILVGATWVAVVDLFMFAPRLATSIRERQGKPWSEDYRDGVVTARDIALPYYPYVLVSSLGLGILALLRRRDPKP